MLLFEWKSKGEKCSLTELVCILQTWVSKCTTYHLWLPINTQSLLLFTVNRWIEMLPELASGMFNVQKPSLSSFSYLRRRTLGILFSSRRPLKLFLTCSTYFWNDIHIFALFSLFWANNPTWHNLWSIFGGGFSRLKIASEGSLRFATLTPGV